MNEFNLSEQISTHNDFLEECIAVEDVKEFIRLVKEAVSHQHPNKKQINYIINKLAGEDLVLDKHVSGVKV